MTDTKSIGDALNTNLQVGTAIRAGQLNDQIADRDNARLRAENERLRERPTGGGGGGGAGNSQFALMQAQGALHKAKEKLWESEALVCEWKHSNEGFKKLAKAYAERLGIDAEELRTDLDNALVELSETDPEFAHTKLGGMMRAKLGK